jgi:hypothetical protein
LKNLACPFLFNNVSIFFGFMPKVNFEILSASSLVKNSFSKWIFSEALSSPRNYLNISKFWWWWCKAYNPRIFFLRFLWYYM